MVGEYFKTHVFYVAVLCVLAVAGWTWLREHDARLLADQQVKVSEARVANLQQHIEANQQAAAATIADLKRRAIAVKTPAQAIAAIPDVTNLPIASIPIPDNPDRVSVLALPLYQELNQCKQDQAALTACQANTKLMVDQLTEKNTEIAALKKKPGFWKRLKGTVKTGGIGVIIGIVIKAALL